MHYSGASLDQKLESELEKMAGLLFAADQPSPEKTVLLDAHGSEARAIE